MPKLNPNYHYSLGSRIFLRLTGIIIMLGALFGLLMAQVFAYHDRTATLFWIIASPMILLAALAVGWSYQATKRTLQYQPTVGEEQNYQAILALVVGVAIIIEHLTMHKFISGFDHSRLIAYTYVAFAVALCLYLGIYAFIVSHLVAKAVRK